MASRDFVTQFNSNLCKKLGCNCDEPHKHVRRPNGSLNPQPTLLKASSNYFNSDYISAWSY